MAIVLAYAISLPKLSRGASSEDQFLQEKWPGRIIPNTISLPKNICLLMSVSLLSSNQSDQSDLLEKELDRSESLRNFQDRTRIFIISFIAATAMGVPPRVPTIDMDGTSRLRRRSLLSAAFTNPTRVPMTRAGLTSPEDIRSQRVRNLRPPSVNGSESGIYRVFHEPENLSYNCQTLSSIFSVHLSVQTFPLRHDLRIGLL